MTVALNPSKSHWTIFLRGETNKEKKEKKEK
jgi:hypothetical protein